jgi:transcriptional regulator with XRE-family HTH domain
MTAPKSRPDPESGARLADALAAKQITPPQLARQAKVSVKSIRRWLKGASISRGNAYAVAPVLKVEPWAIWPDLGPTGALSEPPAAEYEPEPALSVADHGITDVFVSRAELIRAYPPAEILAEATRVRVMGLSLNQIVQSVSDRQLRAAISAGTELQCLFLETYSRYTSDREAEEGHASGTLSQLTATNIHTLKRTQRHLPAEQAHRLQVRTYNAPVRFNIMVIDESLTVVQFYLPAARGTESPALVLRPTTEPPDLFGEFVNVFDDAWATAKEV